MSYSLSTMEVMGLVGAPLNGKKDLPWGIQKQCAAVTAHLEAISVAPHACLDALFVSADAIQGYLPR